MPKITIGTVIKVVIASVIVGFILAKMDLSPVQLLKGVFSNVEDIMQWMVSVFGDAISYALLGAVIVVPIWAISYGMKWLRKEK